MPRLGGKVKGLPTVVGGHAGFRTPACKVLRNSDVAGLGGQVEWLSTLVADRGDLGPQPRQMR